ncbi:MAG: hypothetical protein AAFP77_29090 [Bacteroidota bacterium]
MKNAHALLSSFFTLVFLNFVSAAPTATLVYVGVDCGSGGEVIYEINGDPSLYTYYWEHGPTELHLTGLAAGTYTLHVIDFYGCEEVYNVEIIALNDCTVAEIITDNVLKCRKDIEIEISNPITGELYDTSYFTIEWFDDPEAGFTRTVQQYANTVTYGYIVYANGPDGETCCYAANYVFIPGNPDDCISEKESSVIVNEASTKSDSKGQFVELLVLGNGNCEDSLDMRGYILDDNNGRLISAGELIFESNVNNLGINPGFLVFKHHPNWEKVPHGSLILIYQDHPNNSFPSDDPEDLNGDGVYVLSASNSAYLFGQEGQWQAEKGVFDYEGGIMSPAWTLVHGDYAADGWQVRDATHMLSHGISFGSTPYGGLDTFDLHLDFASIQSVNYQFVQTDYWNHSHFNIVLDQDTISTPGLPNSVQNQDFILALLECDTTKAFIGDENLGEPDDQIEPPNNLSVFPNPFKSSFDIVFLSEQPGVCDLKILGFAGDIVFQTALPTASGGNRETISALADSPSGVYLLHMAFPDGRSQWRRIVHIRK